MSKLREYHGQQIRLARLQRGLTQSQLAMHLGLQQQVISKWEGGRQSPKDEHKLVLAEVLETSPELLFPLTLPTDPVVSPTPALLDMDQAACYLNVGVITMKTLWEDRLVTGRKIGKYVRFRVEDLDEYVDKQRVEAIV